MADDGRIVFVPIDDGAPAEPINWLVEDYIELAATTIFYGYSGTLKSFLLLHMALCIVTGRPFFGRPVRTGPVLIIAGEGRRGLKQRIQAWERHYGVLSPVERARLICPVRERDGRTLTMRVLAGRDGAVAEPLKNMARAARSFSERPVAVIFDTVATTFGLAEETNEQISRALAVLREHLSEPLECAVIASHHTGKDGSRGARGGYSMECDADAVYQVRRADGAADRAPSTPFDCAQHRITVICKKMKDEVAPPDLLIGASRVVLASNGHGDISSLVVTSSDLSVRQQTVLDGLRAGQGLRDIAFNAGCSYGTACNERDFLIAAGLWDRADSRARGRPEVSDAAE